MNPFFRYRPGHVLLILHVRMGRIRWYRVIHYDARFFRSLVFAAYYSPSYVLFSLVPEAFRCASTKARHSLSNGFFHVQNFKMAECMVSNGDANKSIRHGLIVGVSLVSLL